jgi:hypothetical protein
MTFSGAPGFPNGLETPASLWAIPGQNTPAAGTAKGGKAASNMPTRTGSNYFHFNAWVSIGIWHLDEGDLRPAEFFVCR